MNHKSQNRSLSLRQSLGLALILVSLQSACSQVETNDPADPAASITQPKRGLSSTTEASQSVPDEVSLKADRAHLEELRKEIPENVRRENDELALILGLMTNGDEEPSKIRERFNRMVRDRRERNNKERQRRREDFNAREAKAREDFQKAQNKERDEFFARRNTSADERKRFFDERELKSKRFFADAQDRRRTFNAQMDEDYRTFDDHIRKQTSRFDQEYSAYRVNYFERRNGEALKKRLEEKAKEHARRKAMGSGARGSGLSSGQPTGSAGADPLMDEFNSIPKTPHVPLGAPSSGN